jgi:hypothetical protein
MRDLRRAGVLLAASAMLLLFAPTPASAATEGLRITLRAGPDGPVAVLTNEGTQPCRVATTTAGTLTATRVTQDGRVVEATSAPVSYVQPLEYLIETRLRVLEPGRSVELPLPVLDTASGPVLQTVAWAGTTGAVAWRHPIHLNRPVELEVGYDVPIAAGDGPALCAAATASGSLSFAPTRDGGGFATRWLLLGAIGVVAIAVAAVVVTVAVRRRRRIDTVAVVVLFAVAATLVPVLGSAKPAAASFVVDGPVQDMWRQCEAVFRGPGGDPAGIMPILDDPDVTVGIRQTTRGGSEVVTWSNGVADVHWNWDEDARTPLVGSGGGLPPCPSLYHEMYHAAEGFRGELDNSECVTKEGGLSGIEIAEVNATRAENLLRAALGIPQRSHYGRTPLPAGRCIPPEEQDERGVICGNQGCAYTAGDPHLRTFDGSPYSFQAVGEFVLATDRSGGSGAFQIQVRQIPMQVPRIRTASINGAVAFDVAGDRVEARHAENTMELLVGGASRPLETQQLPRGGSLTVLRSSGGARLVVAWPDGSAAEIRYAARAGLTVTVAPADSRKGRLEGLLGYFDGDRANDIRVRGGRAFTTFTHEELYSEYADSWRVDASTSLFTYAPGTGPQTYVDKSFPDRSPAPDTLPNRAAAEALCRAAGVTHPDVLAGCIFDVALTGQPDFARAAVVSQASIGTVTVDGPPATVTVARAGATARLTFTGQAGQTVAVRVSQSTLPDECGLLDLLDAAGTVLGDGCIVGGTGGIDRVRLPADGQYTILLDPASERTGSAVIRVNSVRDETGALRPNGPPVTATVGQPGGTARLTFPGVSGQFVVVGVASATALRDNCGILHLLDPAGKQLASGCVIDGTGGIDPVRLPAAGQYTVVLDPHDDVTGSAQLLLSSVTPTDPAVTPGGSGATATVGQPGAAALLAFDGRAGQRLTIEVSGSTMPDACGFPALYGPTGDRVPIARACVFGGQGGIDAVTLPATGRYTLVFDPHGKATGTARVRLDVQ